MHDTVSLVLVRFLALSSYFLVPVSLIVPSIRYRQILILLLEKREHEKSFSPFYVNSNESISHLLVKMLGRISNDRLLIILLIINYFINRTINVLTERQFTGRKNLFDFDFSPQLTWRDIQHLTVLTSKRNSLFDAKGRFHWTMNGVGLEFNHLFGYGVLDAGAMVALAKKWKTVPPRYHCEAGSVLETQWVYFHSLFHSISRVRKRDGEKHRLALFLSSLHFPFTS